METRLIFPWNTLAYETPARHALLFQDTIIRVELLQSIDDTNDFFSLNLYGGDFQPTHLAFFLDEALWSRFLRRMYTEDSLVFNEGRVVLVVRGTPCHFFW